MQAMLGEEYAAFEAAFDPSKAHGSGIRISQTKPNAQNAVISKFALTERVEWCKSGYYADKTQIRGTHPYHLAGLIYFQEPSAMSAAEGLPIAEGDKVLDLCAAPGGKSTRLAEKLNGTGLLIANEIIKSRAAILSGNIERMGYKNVIVTNESPDRLAAKYPNYFDKIMVDAPCSGEGMFRKEPQAVEEWSVEHTISCAERQKQILRSAMSMLKTGGLLMYSTCTFAPEENEKIALWLTQNGFKIRHIPELDMLSEGNPEFAESDTDDLRLTRRIYPHIQRGEGHFAALFEKTAETESAPVPKKRADKRKGRDKAAAAKDKALENALNAYREFEKKFLNIRLDGVPVLFGESLYLMPEGIDTDGVKVMRCGLHVGDALKGRFEPAHALALALNKADIKQTLDFDAESAEVGAYLHGETLPCDMNAWCAVCADGYVLGWGKASGGVLKNKLPKGLRTLNVH